MSCVRVLVVDDDFSTCSFLRQSLAPRGFEVAIEVDPEEALETLVYNDFNVVVTDLHMHKMTGIDLCRRLKDQRPDVPVIIMTGFGSQEIVTEAIRVGAHDFVTKPFDVRRLQDAILRADEHRKLQGEIRRLRSAVVEMYSFEGLIGQSRSMLALSTLIARAAPSEASIMIIGESGTGKEVVARALHAASRRADGPFVAVNCAALPETLLESELFGHARGAFTDARSAKEGLFVAANDGTLFLDEIGDMPISIQVKLLRAIQERVVRPLGANDEVPFNVRLITATNHNLDTATARGRFREDLFYRLSVVRIDVPPLRARGKDVLLLAEYFFSRSREAVRKGVRRFSDEAVEKFTSYPFPGNVRELENMVEHAIAVTVSDQIRVSDLPDKIRNYEKSKDDYDPLTVDLISMDALEQRYISYVLRSVGGNRKEAARVLRLDRKTLYRKLKRWMAEEQKKMAPGE
jgi:DNA-binding NtrC family response regulator